MLPQAPTTNEKGLNPDLMQKYMPIPFGGIGALLMTVTIGAGCAGGILLWEAAQPDPLATIAAYTLLITAGAAVLGLLYYHKAFKPYIQRNVRGYALALELNEENRCIFGILNPGEGVTFHQGETRVGLILPIAGWKQQRYTLTVGGCSPIELGWRVTGFCIKDQVLQLKLQDLKHQENRFILPWQEALQFLERFPRGDLSSVVQLAHENVEHALKLSESDTNTAPLSKKGRGRKPHLRLVKG